MTKTEKQWLVAEAANEAWLATGDQKFRELYRMAREEVAKIESRRMAKMLRDVPFAR